MIAIAQVRYNFGLFCSKQIIINKHCQLNTYDLKDPKHFDFVPSAACAEENAVPLVDDGRTVHVGIRVDWLGHAIHDPLPNELVCQNDEILCEKNLNNNYNQ